MSKMFDLIDVNKRITPVLKGVKEDINISSKRKSIVQKLCTMFIQTIEYTCIDSPQKGSSKMYQKKTVLYIGVSALVVVVVESNK